ncbi:hypothetical protein RJT34_03294 [Clitoria ternatea]|uniref:Late embryogenesis abundant protein LEA-2 subgroup domain-containing protein n=1 Tax=Clitoria ternatea TaxID=43366 RepID=A0AAN9Q135_CLITE
MEGQAPRRPTGTEIALRPNGDMIAATSSLAPPPGRPNHDFYIVQFPKDQVYRVPPSENALIVEKYRDSKSREKRRGGCCSCCCLCPRFMLTILLIIVSIIAVVGIAFAVLYFVFNPVGPTFAVSDVVVVKNGANKKPGYEVSLKAKNPNGRLGVDYKNGAVWMLYGATEIATGKFPALREDKDETREVKVELSGSSGPLPKAMADEKPNSHVDLKLLMKLVVRFASVGVETWDMRANVMCVLKVRGVGNNTGLLSQDCITTFKQH